MYLRDRYLVDTSIKVMRWKRQTYGSPGIFQVHTILDEIVMGGQVVETNSAEIMRAVQEINKLEKASEPIPTKVKSTVRLR